MKQLMNLNLKKIKYFLTVVEEKNLTRAASKLYVTQPLLSKSIKELEQELEIELFQRDQRSLKVTQAGQYLYYQWSGLINKVSYQIEEARCIQDGSKKQIRFATEYVMVLSANEVWMDAMEQYITMNPEIKVNMISTSLHELKGKLLNGLLDLILCTEYDTHGLENQYHIKLLCKLPVVIYCRKDHPRLKNKKELSWKDLEGESFYTISPTIASWPEELLTQYTQGAGYDVHIAGYTETQMSQIMKIKTTDSLMLSLELKPLMEDQRLMALKMPEYQTSLMLVWHKEASKEITQFAKYMIDWCSKI